MEKESVMWREDLLQVNDKNNSESVTSSVLAHMFLTM